MSERAVRRRVTRWGVVLVAWLLVGGRAAPAADRLVCGFETPADLAAWQITAGAQRLVSEGVTEGRQALELTFNPQGQYDGAHLFWNRVVRDWTPYDALVLDVFNPLDRPIHGSLLIGDAAWEAKNRSYWNRHNSQTTFAPGAGQWVIPVRGLFRGEAGSRNNDLPRDIDADQIVRLDFGFGRRGETGRVIVDHLRFVTVERPAGVRAFDFGPPSQPVMLGWTAVSHLSGYEAATGYGWFPANNRPWDGAARDTTFGAMLTQDFCEAGGYTFRVDVPAGEYELLVIYEQGGYWGGEQAKHRTRSITVNGQQVWQEARPDGAATALYRFEDVEPVGVDLWDTYLAPEIARPIRVRATAAGEGLRIRFDADDRWGSKVAALALHAVSDQPAQQWLAGQVTALAAEFRAKAVCLDPPVTAVTPPAWAGRRLVAWPVGLDEAVRPGSQPPAAANPADLALTADAVRGEFEPLCLAVRPPADLGRCRVELEAGTGWPASTVQVVRYGMRRDFGAIAWRTVPHHLRPVTALDLPAGVTRELVVTAGVPLDAAPGTREAQLVIRAADGAELLRVPLRLAVHDVRLERETDYLMGYFGLEPPASLLPPGTADAALDETLRLLREHGANAVSGGPNLELTGWQNGVPQVNTAAVDAFFQRLARHGFTKAVNGYGGLRVRNLHDGYQQGATGAKVAQASGLDYETALMRVWEVIDQHARQANWPLIYYAMCDETRVREVAERELAFMQAMAKVSARFPRTVRTSGSYSVDFKTRPTDPADLKLWHQRFFAALDVSSLNLHDDTVLAEAAKLGREIHIYNQGTSRYSFGLYQWSEFQRGVKARWQWHLNVLHGYQFFDLDGREPDTSMIVYGREGLYPTIDFERCREGAEDFYLYQTLARRVAANRQAGARPAETQRAADWLTRLTAEVALGQRAAPAGYDALALKREAVALLEAL